MYCLRSVYEWVGKQLTADKWHNPHSTGMSFVIHELRRPDLGCWLHPYPLACVYSTKDSRRARGLRTRTAYNPFLEISPKRTYSCIRVLLLLLLIELIELNYYCYVFCIIYYNALELLLIELYYSSWYLMELLSLMLLLLLLLLLLCVLSSFYVFCIILLFLSFTRAYSVFGLWAVEFAHK
jgi:hypothetical protein